MGTTAECSHLSLVLAITKEDLLEKSLKGVCNDCHEKGPKLWACLHGNCSFIGCGESALDHSSKHYKAKKHSVTVNLLTFRIWCYSCNKEVHLPALFTAQGMKAFKREKEKARKTGGVEQQQKTQDNLPTMLNESNDVPLGLTGLRNLGNTCYMNASLQSLSNCLPLTHHFLNNDTTNENNAAMTKNYRKLVRDMWDGKRPPSLTPSGVHMALKMVNPAFRGYQQQDAQEFLRCIMDRLHEELKYAVSKQEEYNSSTTIMQGNVVGPSTRNHDDFTTNDSQIGGDTINRSRSHSSTYDLHGIQQKDVKSSPRIKGLKPPQHDLKSIISDIFDGKLRSSVQCLTCDQVSHTRETFQDLSLPIPGKDELSRLHGATYLPPSGSSDLPVVPGFKGRCNQQFSTSEMIYSIWEWLKSWVWGPYITLNDCLAAFFSSDELKGDNMYSCDKCKKLRNGVKYCRLLELPEVVCVHLKRFRHEYLTSYSTKISSPVYFPLKGLDLRPYLAQDSPSHCTKYDLCSVIVHLGNAGGGHYMCYAKNIVNHKWYEFDDQYVTEVHESTVANTEAYVLFYCKTSPEAVRSRDRIWSLLQQGRDPSAAPGYDTGDGTNRGGTMMTFLVSVQWLQKLFTFSEPGSVDNRDFVCIHGGILPEKFDDLESLTVPVSEHAWGEIHNKYGGGPSITQQHAAPCEVCRQYNRDMEQRRSKEKEMFLKLDQAENTDSDYFITMTWFRQWEKFLHSTKYDPPGEIDNTPITIVKDNVVRLKPGSDSGPITKTAWEYLHSIYGGGPPVSTHRIRIKSDRQMSVDSVQTAAEQEVTAESSTNEMEISSLDTEVSLKSEESTTSECEAAESSSSQNPVNQDEAAENTPTEPTENTLQSTINDNVISDDDAMGDDVALLKTDDKMEMSD